MNPWTYFWMRLWIAGILTPALLACSSSSTPVIQSVDLSISQQNQSQFVNLSAEINLGNLSLPSLTLPVQDPRTGASLGHVSLGTASDGKPLLTLSLDESAVLRGDSSLGSTLPNGNPVPSSLGVPNGTLLGIPVMQSSRVYVGGDLKTKVYAGIALAIQQLDSIAGNLGGGNLFFSKAFGPVNAVAGLFTSASAHQNGIAVFAAYSIPPKSTTTVSVTSLASAAKATRVQSVSSVGAGNPRPGATIGASVAEPTRAATSAETQQTVNLNQDAQVQLYQYFYGAKTVLRPQ